MASTSSVYTDFHGLSQLKADVRNEISNESIEQVARQFESIFTQMMLKSMRDANATEGGLFDNDQSKMYQEMFDKQVSLSMSEGRGIGLKEMLIRQLGGAEEVPSAKTGGEMTLNSLPDRRPEHAAAQVVTMTNNIEYRAERIESPREFVARMRPAAERAAEELGVSPDVLISQSALETGWGKAIIQDPNGNNSHNLFGIKADGRWQGARVAVPTIEYENGVARKEIHMFRVYDSYEASFNDYANFIQTNPRYENALSVAAMPQQYLIALAQAGYATDPEYASKINTIMESEVIKKTPDPIQTSGYQPLI
ncbi:MAG: flagellar assembly peptidoglycan hydrolase FlgJ [Gammaproteobacteria bacterium]|nr:flagellar assembly peptidoglycan hydrolase FlgJ [Gammaproteobacteria bacterium]